MPNYRSLVPGGFYGNPDDRKGQPASVWSNNPGAVNGANKNGAKVLWVQGWPGFVKTVVIGGGNPIAVFETPEHGVSLWWELMRKYHGWGHRTVQQIVNYYGGGQDYSDYVRFVCNKTGFAPGKVVDLNDDKVLLPFFRAMIHYEAGKPTPLHDAQIAYGLAMARGNAAPSIVPTIAPRSDDFAQRIVDTMKRHNYPLDTKPDEINIIYCEGVNPDGTVNKNRRNAFDDLRVVLQFDATGRPKILGAWEATIETGEYFTFNSIASDGGGAARIVFGYHRGVWQRGKHRGYDALAQTGAKVSVYRDDDKDFSRDPGDRITTDFFGINQHHAWNAPKDNIGKHSAGCLVGRTVAGHERFMELIGSDARYKRDPRFRFSTTVLPQADFLEPVSVPQVSKPAAPTPATEPELQKPAPAKRNVLEWLLGALGLSFVADFFGAHPVIAILIGFTIVAAIAGGIYYWRNK